jgi:hypothetical protein
LKHDGLHHLQQAKKQAVQIWCQLVRHRCLCIETVWMTV